MLHDTHADGDRIVIGIRDIIQVNFVRNAHGGHAPRRRLYCIVRRASAAAGGAGGVGGGLGPAAVSVVFDSAF